MKWIVINAIGALAWLIGIFFTSGSRFPSAGIFASGDHQFAIGVMFGIIGLAMLLWVNFRSSA